MEEKCKNINKSNIGEFLGLFDTILCDCDDVIWNEESPIENSIETLNKLQELGKKLILVTNCSHLTRKNLYEKCQRLKLNIKRDTIYCPSGACVAYLKQQEFKKTVYLIGDSAISTELNDAGIKNVGAGSDPFKDKPTLLSDLESCTNNDVGAVIVGLDLHVSYSKLAKAARYLENTQCHFIATDNDGITTWGDDKIVTMPGDGALIAAMESCSERKATLVGKPSRSLFKIIQEDHGLNPQTTLMIGDTGCTDILFGTQCGLHTLLVLGGMTSMSDIIRWQHSTSSDDANLLADYCLPKLADLLPLIS